MVSAAMQQDTITEQGLEKVNHFLSHSLVSLRLRKLLVVWIEVPVRDILDYNPRLISIIVNQNSSDGWLNGSERGNRVWRAVEGDLLIARSRPPKNRA